MKDQSKPIVKNSLSKMERGECASGQQQLTLPFITSQQSHSKHSLDDVSERLRKLQGNLKMLEKQYRTNLKDGFDHKIKAYRLEAVVQRKLLKEALGAVKEEKERQYIQTKIHNSSQNSLLRSRVEVMKVDREHRKKHLREKLQEQRKGYSLSLYERKTDEHEKAKQSHDRVQLLADNVTVKRDYFKQLREEELRKQERELKHSLVERIMSNTEKLKQLKSTLEVLKDKEVLVEKTFLTL